jgi:hypothetical protein
MSEKQRYPLSWPEGWKRTTNRRNAQFGKIKRVFNAENGKHVYAGKREVSIEDGFDRIEDELRALGVDESSVVVSTNLRVNMRGIPSGNQGAPSDPGAAVYWMRKGKAQCMAIDAYFRVADNLAAVAATLDAMRAIERHGGAQILERAFLGFAQLPETLNGRPWRDVLQFGLSTPTRAMVEERYKSLARARHPDAGGSTEQFNELTRARDQAFLEV